MGLPFQLNCMSAMCYVCRLRNSVSPMYRSFSSLPTATPCITFLVSVCIEELRDSVYSISDAVFKEYGKRVGEMD